MTPSQLIKESVKKFDEKFGKAGVEKNCDSIGKSAGCDDCSINIEEREEHRQFLQERQQLLLEAIKEMIEKEYQEENYSSASDVLIFLLALLSKDDETK